MPTPNDTRLKQFFTAIAMTALFALGILASWGLWCLYHWLYTSPEQWVRVCGMLVHAGFWLNNVIVVALTILSMLDWMRATCGRRERREIHPHHNSHIHPREVVLH